MELRSEQWNELAAALAKAQGAMDNAEKNAANPHFKSKYADLAAVREATIPQLAANGIALVQQIRRDEGEMVLRTTLIHSSGQWIASELPIPHLQRVQELGSYITYARRYSWLGLCGVAADDDDGELANKATATVASGPRRPPPPAKNVMLQPSKPEGLITDQLEHEPDEVPDARTLYLQQIEKMLARAAALGGTTLKTAWDNLDAAERKHFKEMKDERFKPIAQEVDAQQADAEVQDVMD